MKKRVKLKFVSEKMWDNCYHCDSQCNTCPFRIVSCSNSNDINSWVNNKDIFSDEFLNQEIEINICFLTNSEKEYLSNGIEEFDRGEIEYIIKRRNDATSKYFITIKFKNEMYVNFPDLKDKKMYAEMTLNRKYTLEELDL